MARQVTAYKPLAAKVFIFWYASKKHYVYTGIIAAWQDILLIDHYLKDPHRPVLADLSALLHQSYLFPKRKE